MSELEQKSFQKRHIAYKLRISDILGSVLVKEGDFSGHIKLEDGYISRVNVMGIVVYKSDSLPSDSIVIDDGSGRISIRSFDNKVFFEGIDVGDIVLAVGRLREFNNENYILAEITKKVQNPQWMHVRKSEVKEFVPPKGGGLAEEGQSVALEATDYQKVYSLIKERDLGDGVPVEDIIRFQDISDAESIVGRLLKNGDIFEIKPGKLKVLE